MDRRSILGTLAFGIAGLAGCANETPEPTASPTATPTSTPIQATPTPTAVASPTETPPTTEAPTPTEPPPPTPVPEVFRLVSIDAPVRAEIEESVTYRFTVQNTSQETQVIEPTVSTRLNGDAWTVRDRWEPIRIAPGERQTFESIPITSDVLRTVEFRIDGFEDTFWIEFTDKQLPFSSLYRDPLDRDVSVVGLITRQTYSYRTGAGERRIVEAGEGFHWVFVTVTVENKSTRPVATPNRGTFAVLAGGNAYRPVDIRGDEDEYESVRLPRRERYRGRLGFKTPDTFSREQYQVQWRDSFEAGDIGVIWNP